MVRISPQGKHGGWENIPQPLQNRQQWIVMEDKKPVKPASGWQKPSNQLSFEGACRSASTSGGVPAYVLQAGDPFVVVDLDDTGPPYDSGPEVARIVNELDTYTEMSQSGTGLHLICEGTRLPNRSEKGQLEDHGQIEIYDSGQAIVLTGNQVWPFEGVNTGGKLLNEIQREYLPEQNGPVEPNEETPSVPLDEISNGSTRISAKTIKRTLEEYAKDGSEAAQETLNRWNSRAGSALEFPSASEADLGFVAHLAFWCREDARLMDECFRESNRLRAKWDEKHYTDERTYGKGTIETAIRSNSDVFSGHYVEA